MADATNNSLNKEKPVLYRFKELPTNNHVTVLFVGVKGIGMDSLVETMLQTDTIYSMQIRTTTSLPLPGDTSNVHARIDYIVFVIDLSDRQSFIMVQEAVGLTNIDYFLGRCCFILSKAKQEHVHRFDISEATNLVETYDAVMFCGNLDNEDERLNLVDKILHHVEISCGFCTDVNPSLIATTCKLAPGFEEI